MATWFNRTLTIGDLIDIDSQRIDKSRKLKVRLDTRFNVIKQETWLDKLFRLFKRGPKYIYYRIYKFEVKSDSGNTYTVLIKVSPGFDERKFMKNKVQVFCSCADFMYRAAYNLNKSDNLVLIKSTRESLGKALSEAPTRVQTTPVCKHVYAAIEYLYDHRKELDLVY